MNYSLSLGIAFELIQVVRNVHWVLVTWLIIKLIWNVVLKNKGYNELVFFSCELSINKDIVIVN